MKWNKNSLNFIPAKEILYTGKNIIAHPVVVQQIMNHKDINMRLM